MDQPRKPTTPYPAIALFEYVHAPAVGFYYLGTCAFSLCILQKTRAIPQTRRWSILLLMVMILVAYVAEVLYYFSRATGERDYEAPEPAAIRCLGSILVWSPLTCLIWSGKSLRWHAFFGAVVLQFAFETTICLMAAFSIPAEYRQKNAPVVIEGVRAILSLLLLLNAFVILVTKQAEVCTDEERQALLGNQANHSENGTYGTTTDEAAPKDYDKDVKAQQAKRLEEEGGWFGYLKGFAVFLPYLFPRDDWKVMGCLFLRLIYMLQKRVFNLLRPRQLGIITTELQNSYETRSGVMPWKDIGLWVLYSWVNSYGGLRAIDGIADIVISNSAYRRITLLAYNHVLTLSMNFHMSKDSGEVLKAFEQASSLNTLIRMVLFEILPILLDLVVALYYVTQLFDAYMAFIVLFMGAAYITTGWYFTTLSQPRRRDYVEKQRTQSSTVNETVHNWQTVAYFNRVVFEHNRYAENVINTIPAQYSYYFRSMGGHAAQDLLKTFGFAGACIFGMSQIVTGRKPVGNLVTLIMYWNTMTSPLHVLSYS
jgi:ABC-type multidrug transport system fused ATPase/permease subunit